MYATFKGRRILSKKGRDYHKSVVESCKQQIGKAAAMIGRVRVIMLMFPPDKRRRDISNHVKAVEDGLTQAGIWKDDAQIYTEDIMRCPIMPGGMLTVLIAEQE